MMIAAFYLAAAMTFAAFFLAAADSIRTEHSPLPEHPWLYSILAGLCWPLVVVGLAQLGLIVAVRKMVRAHEPLPVQPVTLPAMAASV